MILPAYSSFRFSSPKSSPRIDPQPPAGSIDNVQVLILSTRSGSRRGNIQAEATIPQRSESRNVFTSLLSWRNIALLATLLCPVSVFAQQSPTASASATDLPKAEAKSAINRAIKPIGEEQAIRNLDNCIATGSLKQGSTTGKFTWKIAAQEYWAETETDSIHTVAASNHGTPMRLMNGTPRQLPSSVLASSVPLYNVGMSLLRSRDDETLAIELSPGAASSASGLRITQAKPKDPDIEAAYETWTFDSQTGLPASHTLKPSVYRGRPMGWTAQYNFSDYREASGVSVPRHVEQYTNGQPIRSFEIETFRCSAGLSRHDFELSGGAK